MKNPKLLLNLLYGILGVIAFGGLYILIALFFQGMSIIVSLIWWACGIGAFVGLQIHILRKLTWFEYLENCKEEEE